MQKRELYGGASGLVQTVVKIGGGLLAHEGCLDAVLNAIAGMERQETVLIVPGGGPFADAVRDQDARALLSDDAAHWMAVLAMDQYAHLIASRLRAARLVSDAEGMSAAHRAGEIPVLAPYAWLRRADPLPHSWDVTSDSIAAWVATAVQAGRLLLVKPPGSGDRSDLVDGYFARVRGNLSVDVIAADVFATTYHLPATSYQLPATD